MIQNTKDTYKYEYRYDYIPEDTGYIGYSKQKFFDLTKLTRALKLNYMRSVGSISYLIRSKHFDTVDDWLEYYFKTGEDSYNERKNTLDEDADIHKVNGRTPDELNDLVDLLYDASKNNHMTKHYYPALYDEVVTREDCYRSLIWLVLYHPYNGIVIRENNVCAMLERDDLLEDYTIQHLDYKEDEGYNIDIMLVHKDTGDVLAGYQIKPYKYLSYEMPVSDYSKERMELFKRKYSCDIVDYLYSDHSASTTNFDVLTGNLLVSIYDI